MEHLETPAAKLTLAEAHTYVAALPLPTFDQSPNHLPKLLKFISICQANPRLVNPELPPHQRGPYY